jgi:hypothetical protein
MSQCANTQIFWGQAFAFHGVPVASHSVYCISLGSNYKSKIFVVIVMVHSALRGLLNTMNTKKQQRARRIVKRKIVFIQALS